MGERIPADTQRFCEHCGIIKTFRYIRLVGHSRCLTCGNWEAHNPTKKDIERKRDNIAITFRHRKVR